MSSTLTVSTDELYDLAAQLAKRGVGFAQEGVVLSEARDRWAIRDLQAEQELLRVWQSLFKEGKLAWGYNIDNPGPPFFHLPAN